MATPESCGRGSWARFDDLRAGVSLLCPEPHQVLIAHRPADVLPVLAEVDRASEQGSWAFGYLAYEAAAGLVTGLPVQEPPDGGLPLGWFGLCGQPVRVPAITPPPRGRGYSAQPWQRGWTQEGYESLVERVRDEIAAGQTYQCNLTVRLHSSITGDLEQLYADLMLAQRGSYGAYLDLGRHVIASASPELFFEWAGDRLLTRPMKGTAARGRTTAEDDHAVGRLLASAKERAENIMIVDLLRNDVARVAQVGSVGVPALGTLERYETVWQLTSEVAATLRPGAGLVEIFRALFPSGSVTGAPKRSTMQLLADLEDEPRGVYCGAVGLVAPPGEPYRARFNVAIRTVSVDRATGHAVYGTGGGITWDSDPRAEHAELLAKTAILAEPYEEFQLIETMALSPGDGLRNLERHLDRLADSARYFGFALDLDHARAELAAAVAGAGAARVRLLLSRSGSVRIELGPLPAPGDRPVRLAVDLEPVDSTQRWLFHKTTRRGAYETRAARHPEADDVVLVNERRHATETTVANLAARLDGRWWTPPVESGCLPGIERGRLLEKGRLRERPLTPDDLGQADALALVSSLRGWRPAILLNDGTGIPGQPVPDYFS